MEAIAALLAYPMLVNLQRISNSRKSQRRGQFSSPSARRPPTKRTESRPPAPAKLAVQPLNVELRSARGPICSAWFNGPSICDANIRQRETVVRLKSWPRAAEDIPFRFPADAFTFAPHFLSSSLIPDRRHTRHSLQ